MYLPSLYFSVLSYALSYFHPTTSLHCRHAMSRTVCRPVVMLRSLGSEACTLTTLSKRKALPCWPRKFCDEMLAGRGYSWGGGVWAYPADDLVVVGEVRLAVLAAVDALGVQVDVVGEAHGCGVGWDGPAWFGRLAEVM